MLTIVDLYFIKLFVIWLQKHDLYHGIVCGLHIVLVCNGKLMFLLKRTNTNRMFFMTRPQVTESVCS